MIEELIIAHRSWSWFHLWGCWFLVPGCCSTSWACSGPSLHGFSSARSSPAPSRPTTFWLSEICKSHLKIDFHRLNTFDKLVKMQYLSSVWIELFYYKGNLEKIIFSEMNSTAMFKRKETWAGQSCSTLFMCHVQCLSSKTENPYEYKPDERKKNPNFYNYYIVSANGKI